MKGRQFKLSVPSSNRKERRPPDAYPKTFQKRPAMDLSYPIFKLESRAAYEREQANSTQRLVSSGGSGEETVYASDERDAEFKASCKARAEACETAAKILREARSPQHNRV